MLPVKIMLIIPYFGKLPWYFKYFIHSSGRNPNFHFLVITDDQSYKGKLPENIFLIYHSFEEVKRMIAATVDMPVALSSPYKLCDYRPAYGLVFENYLKDYTFWGHCDLDVIFGCIGNFITDEVLANNDIISIRPEYVSGFFALYRNTKFINTLFKESTDYETVFSTSRYLGFDECGLLCDDLLEGKSLNELKPEIESMTHLIKKKEKEGKIKAYFDLHVVESIPGNMKWDNGELFYRNTYEILLYHLVSFKTHPNLSVPRWSNIPTKFLINETSISKVK